MCPKFSAVAGSLLRAKGNHRDIVDTVYLESLFILGRPPVGDDEGVLIKREAKLTQTIIETVEEIQVGVEVNNRCTPIVKKRADHGWQRPQVFYPGPTVLDIEQALMLFFDPGKLDRTDILLPIEDPVSLLIAANYDQLEWIRSPPLHRAQQAERPRCIVDVTEGEPVDHLHTPAMLIVGSCGHW